MKEKAVNLIGSRPGARLESALADDEGLRLMPSLELLASVDAAELAKSRVSM